MYVITIVDVKRKRGKNNAKWKLKTKLRSNIKTKLRAARRKAKEPSAPLKKKQIMNKVKKVATVASRLNPATAPIQFLKDVRNRKSFLNKKSKIKVEK